MTFIFITLKGAKTSFVGWIWISGFVQPFKMLYLINDDVFLPQTGGGLQNKVEGWKDLVNHTREARPRTPSRLDDNVVGKKISHLT